MASRQKPGASHRTTPDDLFAILADAFGAGVDAKPLPGILPAMTTVTVRELQKNLKRALLRVERGETLQITRRRRAVANLTPTPTPHVAPKKPAPWPDLAARSKKIMDLGNGRPIDAAQIIIDSRGTW